MTRVDDFMQILHDPPLFERYDPPATPEPDDEAPVWAGEPVGVVTFVDCERPGQS